ncbi:transglycosylase family protein [Streptomyces sp. NPDC058405]|uniref:transglycosylase family protein n=1 Tax=Streptomyces sp. NPDC058405 TaxID=3346482 RepID=UPI0036686DE8
MRSANGRHRRPRQAPALIVAAGVTGSALAIPLLGATGAVAADATTWDHVAECESGGMWSADLGNGYYGGLQISQETWDDFGGGDYAARADLASRSQQIAIAEKVLAAQGPTAWLSCAAISGLTDDGALPGVDPGATPDASGTPKDRGSADPADMAPSKSPSKSPSTPDGTSSDGAENQTDKPAPSGSAGGSGSDGSDGSDAEGADRTDPATGKHRGDAAPEESASGNSGEDRESGRHASRGDGSTRDGDGVDAGAEGADGAYTVQSGDCLWLIADEQEVPGGWTALYEANKDAVGSDPDLILPGQTLDLGVK